MGLNVFKVIHSFFYVQIASTPDKMAVRSCTCSTDERAEKEGAMDAL